MLKESEIRKNLKIDPDWAPSDNASDAEWDLYDAVCEELFSDDDENEDDEYSAFGSKKDFETDPESDWPYDDY